MEIPKTLTGNRLIAALILLAILGIGWRLMPHIPNFAPIGAIALLAGTLLPKKHTILLLLCIMLITDTALGFYLGFEWTWLSLALVIPIGLAVRKLPLLAKSSVGALGASLVFFIVSNFGVWLTSGMYPPTMTGLISCYFMAIPFFGATLASNFAFSTALFGISSYLQSYRSANRRMVEVATCKN